VGNTVQDVVAEVVKNFDAFRTSIESLDDFRYVISQGFWLVLSPKRRCADG